jgi:tetratricopeptide (TPR) repeat protein
LQEAFSISTSQKYKLGIGQSYLWLGRVYYYKDEYDISIAYLDKAIKVLDKIVEFKGLAFCYYSKGEIYKLKGDYTEAFSMLNKAIEINSKTNNIVRKSVYLCSIGSLLLKREKPDDALQYFREALDLIAGNGNSALHKSSLFSHIGMVYEQKNLPDSALFYYYQSLKIRESLNDERNIASSKHSIGCLLIQMGDYTKAEKLLNQTRNIYINLDEKTGICLTESQIALAKCYQNDSNCSLIIETALQMAHDINNPWLEANVYGIMSEIAFHNDDFENAFECQKKQNHISDSLFTAEKERLMTEFETRFQAEHKDNEILKLKNKANIQKYNILLLSIVAGTLACVIILLIFLFRYKSVALKRKQILLQKENIINYQNNELVEKENLILKKQLESKNRELASKALEMIRFNDTISVVINKLENFNNNKDNKNEESASIKRIIYELENQTKHNIWLEFDKIFKNIHSGFYERLLKICPELSSTEIKMAALLKLNLTTKEIAAITFKSDGGIKTARYRLRKKLSLSSDEKLIPFLLKI